MYESLISADQLRPELASPDWVVVDCRYDLADPGAGRRAYRDAHIPGAVYAHLHDDLSHVGGSGAGRHPLPDPARIVALFSGMGIDAATQVVAYDAAGGSIACRLWWMLRYLGHRRAAVLDGGWPAWVAAGHATDARPAVREPRRFQGVPDPRMLVTLADVPTLPLLVDSRDPPRYRGEIEPIDPVAGHIPGARNRFWKSNLDDTGRFRAVATLRRDFEALAGGHDPGEVTFYCGSGVTACHNVLAAVHAGLPMPRLYAGSWSEWCADPARPVSRTSG